jgi:hypothetical protein
LSFNINWSILELSSKDTKQLNWDWFIDNKVREMTQQLWLVIKFKSIKKKKL